MLFARYTQAQTDACQFCCRKLTYHVKHALTPALEHMGMRYAQTASAKHSVWHETDASGTNRQALVTITCIMKPVLGLIR